jgi:hypothetical protein
VSYQDVFHRKTIAISASNSPDMAYLGLGDAHLRDAMAELARHLLALGAQLCYGGDLRSGGFSELLFEIVQRHRRDIEEDSSVGITNFLAWPVHIRIPFAAVDRIASDLAGIADLVCLNELGRRMPLNVRRQIPKRRPSAAEWTTGLTSMRKAIQAVSHARIVLGGAVRNFKGSMPGIAEESLLSLTSGTPLYVIGGFGGCARDIAETIGLTRPWASLPRSWPGRTSFKQFGPDSLKNGLTEAENRILAETPHIDQAIILILKGLVNIDS